MHRNIIQLLAKGDKMRSRLEKEFLENWRKPSSCGTVPKVIGILKVLNPKWHVRRFDQYKQEYGNEVLRYHGTPQLCDLGLGKNSKLCEMECCNQCSILRSGFKIKMPPNGWQRYGRGIYTTQTSGKSDYYTRRSSNTRAVLVCRVAAGKVFTTQENMPTLECPPPGYNSVLGEPGKNLTYDETVVYSSKAILPAYMIVYTL